MKIIEKISPNVKKCYKAPEVRIFGVEEECIFAGGSPIRTDTKNPITEGDGDITRGTKHFGFRLIDDEETE